MRLNEATCCGKPVGCNNRDIATCRIPMHAWKRSALDRDPRIRCQATCWPDAGEHPTTPVDKLEMWQCALPSNHDGGHDPAPIGFGCPAPLTHLTGCSDA